MNASDPSITRTTWRFRSEILQNVSQHPVAAPRLDPAAHGLVVRIALRQHLPLGPSVLCRKSLISRWCSWYRLLVFSTLAAAAEDGAGPQDGPSGGEHSVGKSVPARISDKDVERVVVRTLETLPATVEHAVDGPPIPIVSNNSA